MKDETGHAALVDRWLGRTASGLSGAERLVLFEKALAALWRRGHVTLGEVTLGAVVERVLHYGAARFPFLALLRVETDGVHFEELKESLDPKDQRLMEAFRFVLIELLTVLGNLTDDVIIPSLHSGVFKVVLIDPKAKPSPSGRHQKNEGEGPKR